MTASIDYLCLSKVSAQYPTSARDWSPERACPATPWGPLANSIDFNISIPAISCPLAVLLRHGDTNRHKFFIALFSIKVGGTVAGSVPENAALALLNGTIIESEGASRSSLSTLFSSIFPRGNGWIWHHLVIRTQFVPFKTIAFPCVFSLLSSRTAITRQSLLSQYSA